MNKIFLTCIASIFLSGNVWADHTRETLKEAVTFMQQEESQKAYDHLIKLHNPESTDPQEWFLLGMAAKKTGRYDAAETYFNQVLILDPKAVRVKLEMAELEYLRGNLDGTKNLLLEAKNYNPPQQVSETIDRFVQALSAGKVNKKEVKNWRLWGSLGWLYDTNVNAGPNIDRVTFFGLPFTLSSNAQASEDSAIRARFGFDHIAAMGKNAGWQSNVAVSWTDYKDINSFDTLFFSVSTGPAWQQGEHGTWSIPIVMDWINFGYADNYFSYSYGIAPQYRYKLDAQTTLGGALSLNERKYDSASNRQVVAYGFTPSLQHAFTPNTNMVLRANFIKEEAGLDFFSNEAWGISGQFNHNLTKNLLAGLQGSYSRSFYKGREPAYVNTDTRRDEVSQVGMNMVYHIDAIDIDAIASVQHTENRSNIPLYQFSREQYSISFRKAF